MTGTNSNQQEVNYFLTDHFGCIRVIVDGNGVVKERNDYYPFGARHVRGDYALKDGNRYKYNGKEEQVTGDLDYLDYGARMYDSRLGRWFSMDPLAGVCYSITPYCYTLNSPLNLVDPNGAYFAPKIMELNKLEKERHYGNVCNIEVNVGLGGGTGFYNSKEK